MVKESEIFSFEGVIIKQDNGFHDAILLKTTAFSNLYRISKEGKHFLIKTAKDNSERARTMLRREYELSIGCSHHNIVHIFTYEYNTPVGEGIVMEYIDGRSLDIFLSENPSHNVRKRIFAELLSAVGYLHKHGIIHNDIKPTNILISHADNTLKLIDLGLADNDANYVIKRAGCTRQYASPELLAQNETLDTRSDIYSVGVVMKEIFQNKYTRVVAKCTKKIPAERYSDISQLQQAWKNRNKHWKWLGGIIVTIIFLLPLILYGIIFNNEQKADAVKNSVLTQITHEVDSICDIAIDSIKNSPYREFAFYQMDMLIYTPLTQYQETKFKAITNVELNTLAINHYTQLITPILNNITMEVDKKPSLYDSNLSIDEIIFYDSLLNNRLTFQPYDPNKQKTRKDNFLYY